MRLTRVIAWVLSCDAIIMAIKSKLNQAQSSPRPVLRTASPDSSHLLSNYEEELHWAKVIRGSGPARLKGFKRCADGMDNWLDFVNFPADTWADVKRLKWNTHGTLPFFGEAACGFKMEPVSNVTEQETVVVKDDLDFWKNSWDVAALKSYFAVLFPGFKEAIGEGDAAIDALFARLTMAMGGEGAVKDFTWPCVLLLATRR